MLGAAGAALFGFSFGCNNSTNEPTVPGGGSAVEKAPKNMNEFYEKNQSKIPAKKGAANQTPASAPAK